MEGQYFNADFIGKGHQLRAIERFYTRQKEDAENHLLWLVNEGIIKVGSPRWREYSDRIEELHCMAVSERDRYEDNV